MPSMPLSQSDTIRIGLRGTATERYRDGGKRGLLDGTVCADGYATHFVLMSDSVHDLAIEGDLNASGIPGFQYDSVARANRFFLRRTHRAG